MRRHIQRGMVSRRLSGLSAKLLACADDGQECAISGNWTPPGSSEPQTFTGRINAGGEVELTYNGIGQQTYTNQHFTVQMTGRMAEGIITAGGRAGSNGRDFTVRVQCR
jgi:hypothetical protein